MQKKPNKFFKIAKYVVIIVLIGIGIWALILPRFTNKTANESIEEITTTSTDNGPGQEDNNTPTQNPQPTISTVRSGSFSSLNGQSGSGAVSQLNNGQVSFIRLEDSFKVSNGPDLYVALGNGGKVDEATILSKLKANNGAQNYEIPANIDLARYTQVFIYCKAFAYPFSVANLQ